MAAMLIRLNGITSQNTECQPRYSKHQAPSGVPMLGPKVAVSV